jgi:hypothetical protein
VFLLLYSLLFYGHLHYQVHLEPGKPSFNITPLGFRNTAPLDFTPLTGLCTGLRVCVHTVNCIVSNLSCIDNICIQVKHTGCRSPWSRRVRPWLLEPEPTQHSKPTLSGQTPDKDVKINHFFVHDSGYKEPDPTSELSPTNSWLWQKKRGLFRADSLVRYFVRLARDSSVSTMDKKYLIELVRDIPPLWDQRGKKYHNRDIKPKLWDEIREELKVTALN